MMAAIKKYDTFIAVLFAGLIMLFIAAAFTTPSFWDWLWQRHHNQLSWYIRPLFLIPFCWFAYRRSWAGIMMVIFLTLTSMGWFAPPSETNLQVQQFLQVEQQYLRGEWTFGKIFLTLLIPLSFSALAAALWWRNIWLGVAVMALMAAGKLLWSITFSGEAGLAVIAPATIGFVLCSGCLWLVTVLSRRRIPRVKKMNFIKKGSNR